MEKTIALFIAPPMFGKTRIFKHWMERQSRDRLQRVELYEAHQHRGGKRLMLLLDGPEADLLATDIRAAARTLEIDLHGLYVQFGPILPKDLRRAELKHAPHRERPLWREV